MKIPKIPVAPRKKSFASNVFEKEGWVRIFSISGSFLLVFCMNLQEMTIYCDMLFVICITGQQKILISKLGAGRDAKLMIIFAKKILLLWF